jgi:hypothetical protein
MSGNLNQTYVAVYVPLIFDDGETFQATLRGKKISWHSAEDSEN